MMGYGWGGMMGEAMGTWGTLGILTWFLVVVFLILGIGYFWKELNRKR